MSKLDLGKKSPEQIADDIFSCGDAAFSAAKFPSLLEEKIRAGGHQGDITKIKLAVALICNIRRRNRRAA